MTRHRSPVAGVLAIAALLSVAGCGKRGEQPQAAGAAAESTLAITHVTVVDVAAGALLADRTVLVRGGRIAAADTAPRVAVPAGATVVDGRGRYLIPGLWDFHVHALFDPEAARVFLPRFVASGVTGVRDMGGKVAVLRLARWAIFAGTLTGPRIWAAGRIIDGPQPVDTSVSIAVGTPEEARAAVDTLAAHGADFIEVYTLLPPPAYFAALREAARLHLAVAGHVPTGVSTLQAADSGQRSIEHLRDEVAPLCGAAVDAACDRLLDSLRAHGVWLVPTLVVLRVKAILDDSSLVLDPRLPTVPDLVRRGWEGIRDSQRTRPAAYWREKRARFFAELEVTGEAAKRGVPLLAGTDAGALFTYPGSSLHDELAQLVRAGLTPAAALRSATLAPAEFLGATDSMGTVAAGKVADLVLLDADPLADIANTRGIRAVVLRGRLFDRAALDTLGAGALTDASLLSRLADSLQVPSADTGARVPGDTQRVPAAGPARRPTTADSAARRPSGAVRF